MKLKTYLLSIALLAGILLFSYCKKDKDKTVTPTGTCSDGIKNQNETDVDCGGLCSKCMTCSDGIKNQGETDIDCGGPCGTCPITYPDSTVFGKNLLGKKNNETIDPGYYGLAAKLPAGTKIRVKISNGFGGTLNYGYVPANTNYQVVNEQGQLSQSFYADGPLSANAQIDLGLGIIFPPHSVIKIEVFENDSTDPTWTRFVTW